MLTQQTITKLSELKLRGMAQAYGDQIAQPSSMELSFDERLGMLVDREYSDRETRKLGRMMKASRFRFEALFEDISYSAPRGLDKALFATLGSCDWVRHQQHILFTGATGTGKTWLACAMGMQAVRQGLTASYWSAPELFSALVGASADGSLPRVKKKMIKTKVLIVDDLGLGEISIAASLIFLQIIDLHARDGSLIITSQYPLDRWHSLFSDPTLADAILDRIVHSAHKIQLKGESMRKTRASAAKK